jgi:hypothetical protein
LVSIINIGEENMEYKKTFMMDASIANSWQDTIKLFRPYEGIVRNIPVLNNLENLDQLDNFFPPNGKYTVETEWAIEIISNKNKIDKKMLVKLYRYLDFKNLSSFSRDPYCWGKASYGVLFNHNVLIRSLGNVIECPVKYNLICDEITNKQIFQTNTQDYSKFPFNKIFRKIYIDWNLNDVEVINLGAKGCHAAYVNCLGKQIEGGMKSFFNQISFNPEKIKQETVGEIAKLLIKKGRYFINPIDLLKRTFKTHWL